MIASLGQDATASLKFGSHDNGHQYHQHHNHGQCTAERPVKCRSELANDDIRDHYAAGTSQQCWCHEISEAKCEGKNTSSYNARYTERHEHPLKCLPRCGAKVETCFNQLL